MIHHGFGVIEFEDFFKFNRAELNGWIERRFAEQPEDYTLQDDGSYLNRGGYRFEAKDIESSPRRALHLTAKCDEADLQIFQQIYNAVGEAVDIYMKAYPDVKKSVWWRTDPHLAAYGISAGMGFHHDNLVGDGEESEASTQNVLTASLVLDDECEGGELAFRYPECVLPPKFGSVIVYSSGYLGTHAVFDVKSGRRVSYLEFFGHGTRANAVSYQRS